MSETRASKMVALALQAKASGNKRGEINNTALKGTIGELFQTSQAVVITPVISESSTMAIRNEADSSVVDGGSCVTHFHNETFLQENRFTGKNFCILVLILPNLCKFF